MRNDARGLVENLVATVAQRGREIELLVKGRGVAIVEATDLLEQVTADKEARAGHDVDFADIVVGAESSIAAAAIWETPSVAVDDAAGLLDGPVGVEQLAPDHPDARVHVDERHHRA